MSLVRLQCPACSAIVKVSDEIVAQHPIVRCAKCQGLVTVATGGGVWRSGWMTISRSHSGGMSYWQLSQSRRL